MTNLDLFDETSATSYTIDPSWRFISHTLSDLVEQGLENW